MNISNNMLFIGPLKMLRLLLQNIVQQYLIIYSPVNDKMIIDLAVHDYLVTTTKFLNNLFTSMEGSSTIL